MAKNELLEPRIVYKAYKLAIYAWICADTPENASDIIENLPQDIKIAILKKIISYVLKKVNYLIKNKNNESAIRILNVFIRLYHLNDLNSELQTLNKKQLHLINLMTKSSQILKKNLKKNKK